MQGELLMNNAPLHNQKIGIQKNANNFLKNRRKIKM